MPALARARLRTAIGLARAREGVEPAPSRCPAASGASRRPMLRSRLSYWCRLFELENAGVTHCPVEVRHPFFDLRIVNYLLALPPFPSVFRKEALCESGSGAAAREIRTRRKSPLAGDPVVAHFGQPQAPWMRSTSSGQKRSTRILISPYCHCSETIRFRRRWKRMFALSALTFGCSQRAESGITCVRRSAMA